MTAFTTYSPATGNAISSGIRQEGVTPDLPDGAALFDGQALSPMGWYFVGGEPVAYTPEQAAAKAQRPPHPAKWDNALMTWVDQRSLEQAKADKNAEINAARMRANRSTFAHAGKTFSCDELSRSDIDGVNGIVSLTSALPPAWPGAWKAVDNSYLLISTVPDWAAFYGAMVAQGTANFVHAQELKAQLAAATTAEEVAAIAWGDAP